MDLNECCPFRLKKFISMKRLKRIRSHKPFSKPSPIFPSKGFRTRRALIKQFLSTPDPIGIGKKHLLITHFYGRRLKPCPGTSHHICCGYYVINAITNCPMDCSYCVLQGYLNNPFLTLYTNWDDLLQEIETFFQEITHPSFGWEQENSLTAWPWNPSFRSHSFSFHFLRRDIMEFWN